MKAETVPAKIAKIVRPMNIRNTDTTLPLNVRGDRGAGLRGYTGHKHNSYIKLVDMKARWYSPQLGRFIQPDTIIPDPANPQSFNRYAYVLSYVLANPLKYRDPSGYAYDAGNEFAGSYEVDNERLRSYVEKGAIPKSVAILSEYYYSRYKANPDLYRGTSTELYAAVYSEYALGRNLNHPDAIGFRLEFTIPAAMLKLISLKSTLGDFSSIDVNVDRLIHQDTGESDTFVTIGLQVAPVGDEPQLNVTFGSIQVRGISELGEYEGNSAGMGLNAASLEVDYSRALDYLDDEPWHSPSTTYWGISLSPVDTYSGYLTPIARTWSWARFRTLLPF